MPPLPEPPRCACPKCSYDLRGIELDGYDVVCPECGGRWEPWNLAHEGGRPHWSTPVILASLGVGGFVVCALILFTGGPLLMMVFGLAALSDASLSLGPFNLLLLGVLSAPLVVSGALAFQLLRASYRKYNWPEPGRRARVRALQLVAVQFGVLFVLPRVLEMWLRLFG